MKVRCPNCEHDFHAPHPHLTVEGMVPVRIHRRKKRTFYVRAEDLDEDVQDALRSLEHENTMLRRVVSAYSETSDDERETP